MPVDSNNTAPSGLLNRNPLGNGIFIRSTELAEQFGVRLLPYFSLLALAAGFLTGGLLFGMLEDYQNLLPNGAPTVFAATVFHLLPGIIAAAYALFNAPVMARNSLRLFRAGEGRVLQVIGVPGSAIVTWPSIIGAFLSLLVLTVATTVIFLVASMVAWRLAHGTPALPVLGWIEAALFPPVLLLFPLKLFAFSVILSCVPIAVARQFNNLEDLTDRGGFFRISFLLLLGLLLTELLSILSWLL